MVLRMRNFREKQNFHSFTNKSGRQAARLTREDLIAYSLLHTKPSFQTTLVSFPNILETKNSAEEVCVLFFNTRCPSTAENLRSRLVKIDHMCLVT